jgi:DNA replication protein DnaC
MKNITTQEIDKKAILKAIGEVFEQAKKCKLEHKIFDTLQKELKLLSAYFKTSSEESFFLSVIYSMNYKGDYADLNDLIDFYKCSPTKILEFSDILIQLNEKNYTIKSLSKHRVHIALANYQYMINSKITDAIMQSKELPELSPQFESIYTLIEKTYELVYESKEGASILNYQFYKKIIPQDSFGIIKKLREKNLKNLDILCLFYIIWKQLLGHWDINLPDCFQKIYGNGAEMIAEIQKVQNKQHALIITKLLETDKKHFSDDTAVKLSSKAKKFLKPFNITFKKEKVTRKNTIKPKKTQTKKLFYNTEEEKQINTIAQLLQGEKLKETRKRLSEKKLPRGVNIVFYGPPGTGKTESVLQIAKATNRDIIKVDISAAKSMWFGESEKITKRIFTDYKKLMKHSKRIPILFINEADALISRRTNNTNGAVDKTENTIQNIFLEELENFDGILIATTNLVGNMDKAFERRFLFKVEINKPGTAIKSHIWKEKLPDLNRNEALRLAESFDFSGGQIENIVRKKEIEEIIQGKEIAFEEIFHFCKAELFEKTNTKIGFQNN